MVNIIVEISKYLIILLIIMYTYLCFTIFGYHDMEKKAGNAAEAECAYVSVPTDRVYHSLIWRQKISK